MNPAQHINQDSGKVEYYTPPEIIEAARATMGSIDFDPFSCEIADRTVKAELGFFTKEHGEMVFQIGWNVWPGGRAGTVWMNHPFSRAMNKRCIDKLISEFKAGNVHAACCITFASTSEAWFRPLLDYPQCYLSPRTNYLDEHGNKVRGVTKGSVVTFLGPDSMLPAFRQHFGPLGAIKV